MLLKRLKDLPEYVLALLPQLEHHTVQTTEAVLTTPRDKLLTYISPRGAETAAALDELIAHCLLWTAPAYEPLDVQANQSTRGPWRGVGVVGVDDMLEGWDGCGVVEVCGSRASGKTLICLHAMLRAIGGHPTANARWIDTDGTFNATKAREVLRALGADDAQIAQILGRVTVSRVFKPPELVELLGQISDDDECRVIVVDNAGSLFGSTLGGNTSSGHATMVSAIEALAEFTYSHSSLTLIANRTVMSGSNNPASAFSATVVKPGLGPSFQYAADIHLLLQESGKVFGFADETERERTSRAPGLRVVVEVLKSRVSRTGLWAVLETNGTALFDVLPPPEVDDLSRRRSAGMPTGRPQYGPLRDTIAPGRAV